jgi:hypothetical protein
MGQNYWHPCFQYLSVPHFVWIMALSLCLECLMRLENTWGWILDHISIQNLSRFLISFVWAYGRPSSIQTTGFQWLLSPETEIDGHCKMLIWWSINHLFVGFDLCLGLDSGPFSQKIWLLLPGGWILATSGSVLESSSLSIPFQHHSHPLKPHRYL